MDCKADISAVIKKAFEKSIDDPIQNLYDDGPKKDDTDVGIPRAIIRSSRASNDKIMEQLTLFMLAGHATTATTTWWLIRESTFLRQSSVQCRLMYTNIACKLPSIQTHLCDEIRRKLSKSCSENAVDTAKVDDLKYLHACINGTMRLYPGAPWQCHVTGCTSPSLLGSRSCQES